jgi:hypothetical protein
VVTVLLTGSTPEAMLLIARCLRFSASTRNHTNAAAPKMAQNIVNSKIQSSMRAPIPDPRLSEIHNRLK